MEVRDIRLNNQSVKNNVVPVSGNFKLLIPPGENTISLRKLKEMSLFADETKTMHLQLSFEDDELQTVSAEFQVGFIPDTRLLILLFIFTNLFIIILIYLIWKYRK